MIICDYTLCYNQEDGKLHIGRCCGEEKELFSGDVTDEIAEVEGYEGHGSTLVLRDFTFATSADLALAVPGGTTIVLEGKNDISVVNNKQDANVGVLYSSGDLTLDSKGAGSIYIHAETEQGLWSRAVCARAGDLTINGGAITANGGRARKSCGLYAGGRLWIEIGEKGKISLNGGSVSVVAGKNAIRAAEGKLFVAAGACITNAQEYTGADAWTGDCLSPIDDKQPVTISF